MSKKILGLVVSVALLMVVLSGCFLLPQIDTFTPLVTIVSPAPSQTITVPTSTSSTNVTVTATVLAHSPIQSVQVSLVQNGQNYGTFNMSGAFGQNTGSFSYTFTNLPVGSYYLTVTAQSGAKTPGSASQKFTIASAQPVTPPSTKYAAPVVSLINVAPNYQGKYYVAQSPITFSATVTNPNKVGQVAVWASVNGQTIQPNNNANPYTFTWTPSSTGTYTLYVNATVTIGASTVSGSNSVVIKVPYISPAVNSVNTPSRLVMATTTPASFTFTTTPGVSAYLSINGGSAATYTSQSPIANVKLLPNQWNTLTLTFKDPWGYTIQTAVATVLGVQTSNPANTPYVFLIDKAGHVVNTNDWISIPAGSNLDLYGYIQAGSQPITSFNLTQQYFTSKMLTTSIAGPGTVLSGSYPTPQNIVPIKLLAYLFNPQVAPNHAYVTFSINVNNTSIAFLRYDVSPVTAAPVVTLSSTGTYEGVPAQVTVNVNSLQPITGITLGVPVKVNSPFTGYSTTTAYSNAQNGTNSMSFTYNLIEPVSAVQANGANAYGFVYGSQNYKVAFYGPSGIYTIGATVAGIANMTTYATTNYAVQADTSAPTVKVTYAGSSVSISGISIPVYYGPMTIEATVNDDHAIYWAMMTSPATAFLVYPNNSNIANYGQRATTITAKVSFTQPGTYNAYIIASDKHFDPTTFTLNQTVLGTGNTVRTPNYPVLYSNVAPQATAIGGQYQQTVNTEKYAFAVSAKDNVGGYSLLSPTAFVRLVPIKNSNATTVTLTATFGTTLPQQPNYYSATISTYGLTNQTQYNVWIGVKDLIYDALAAQGAPQSLLSQHITWVNWGIITVDLVYPNVTLSAGTQYQPLSATPTTVSTTVFRVDINNDPDFPWGQFAENNYNQLLNYINVQVGNAINGFNTAAYVIPLQVTQTSTQSGYFLFAIPGLYQNVGMTNQVATQTIQVSVYNSIQPEKSIFGQIVRTVIPQIPFTVSISGVGVTSTANGMAATPVINTTGTYTLPVTISGLTPNPQPNMTLTFMVNNTPALTVQAANGTYNVPVPTPAGTALTSVRVLYAPSYYQVPGAARVNVQSFNIPSTYQYFRYFSTFYTLGDNITPSATLTLNGVSINGQATVLTKPFNYTYSINGVLYYLHDLAVTSKFATGNNTTISGVVNFSSYSTSTTTVATTTLKATSLLSSLGFEQGSKWTISKLSTKTFSMPGVYNISFTGNDPRLGTTTVSATVAFDPYAPVISGVKLNGNAVPNVTSGLVPVIANGNTISAVATDYAGVQSAKISVVELIDNAATSYAMTNHFGLKAFTATAQANVTLPTVFAPQYQNLPYEVTFYATNVAGLGAQPVTRLFVTNVDHSPKILNIKAVAPNQAVVTLSEPMWVNGFKAFTANSATYGGTITSTNISPVTVLANYQGYGIAAQFTVTFGYNVWTPSQVGNSVFTDLSNVQLSSSISTYVPIVDLAGNTFAMPINTTTPPTLFVSPTSTVVGKGWNVTFTVNATSAAGIKEVVGSFNGQTKYVYGPTGSMTFVAPTVSGTYTASFTAQDESVNQNKTTVTALVYVNTAAPSLTLTAPATVGSGMSFTATVKATVGDPHGSNVIKSVAVYYGTQKFVAVQSTTNPASWTASVTLTGNQYETLTAIATDLYGNSASKSTSVYVDDQAPTITVTLIGGTGSTLSPYTLTTGSSVTLYTSSLSGLSGTITVVDNSKMPVTAIATESTTHSTKLTFTTTSGASVATFKATGTVNGHLQYTIKASSTDHFGHNATYLATFTLVVDTQGPTVAATAPTTELSTTSTYASVTYKAYDDISGIVGNQATLTITSKVAGTSPITLYENSTTASKTINVLPNLLANGFAGKSGSATVTVTAKSNSGVLRSTTNSGNVINFNFTFNITNVQRLTTSGSPVVITFNTVAKANSSFTPSNVYFVNTSNGITYQASAIVVPTGTTKVATITQFSILGSNALVTSQNLPSGSYKVYVSNIVGATPTTNNAQVANSPYSGSIQ
ncbi:beta strand repeat-containing protein [Athalassotoga saccharophila]|uniref:beta strand repeat-containing protein n=1 Tax=Athalassotoga saccharophila TaxID=1441386 RepID=UPI001379727C|nr:Ig-like domain-containing protein [Athalassotoga saccharophila]BBJ27749.1 hypothetical protein ATHSA_0640 [Athalassotoga saccharophila]